MSNVRFERKYPGRTAAELYAKAEGLMEKLAQKASLHCEKDAARGVIRVKKMGAHGECVTRDGELTVDLHIPILFPGHVKKQLSEYIEHRLDNLFA